MFSKPQNHHKSTPRQNFDIIPPPPFDIKNMRNLTPPAELPETFKFNFKITKTKWEIGVALGQSNKFKEQAG